ncbi:hypothetical protein VPH35_073064 [Triticum aestivum]
MGATVFDPARPPVSFPPTPLWELGCGPTADPLPATISSRKSWPNRPVCGVALTCPPLHLSSNVSLECGSAPGCRLVAEPRNHRSSVKAEPLRIYPPLLCTAARASPRASFVGCPVESCLCFRRI